MKKKIIPFFLLLAIMAFAHPIKMTTGKLQYLPKEGLFELTVNFFIDDFEASLQKEYSMPTLKLFDNRNLTKKLIADYTSKKLAIKMNGIYHPANITEISLADDNVIQAKYKMPVQLNGKIEQLEISNQFLFEAFADQVNIMHVVVPGKEEKIMLKFMSFEYRKIINF